MTGFPIEDLTSGFRAARARHFRKFLYLLPNKFSYPTTSTMAFFRSGLPVGYVPIKALEQNRGEKKSYPLVPRRLPLPDYHSEDRRPVLSDAVFSTR